MFKGEIDTCMNRLTTVLDEEMMEECESFIKIRNEARHYKTLERQVSKFERLCHKYTGGCPNVQHGRQHDQDCSKAIQMTNGENNTRHTSSYSGQNITPGQDCDSDIGNIWVRNLSKTPLTEAQEHVLACRPNFAIVPKVPPVMEYIVAIEKACQQLNKGRQRNLEVKLSQ